VRRQAVEQQSSGSTSIVHTGLIDNSARSRVELLAFPQTTRASAATPSWASMWADEASFRQGEEYCLAIFCCPVLD
jgi:hypothetical protein